jgi:PglZ domain-containing protein
MSDDLQAKLADRLRDLFDQYRVVVWHDPSDVLGPLLRAGLPEGVEMPAFKGNPLSLRQGVDRDPWLQKKWLLYVPPPPEGVECEWLADYEQGFFNQPNGNLEWALREFFGLSASPDLTRRLRGPAANRLAARFGELFVDIAKPLRPDDVTLGLLRAAIGAPQATEMDLVIRFLTVEADERRWRELDLLPALTGLIRSRLGLRRHLMDGSPPERGPICRCLVAAALVEGQAADAKALSNHLPESQYRSRWSEALSRGLEGPDGRALTSTIQSAMEGSDLGQALSAPMSLADAPPLPFVDARMQELLLGTKPRSETQEPAWWQEVAAIAEQRRQRPGLDESVALEWSQICAGARLLEIVRERSEALSRYPAASFARIASDYVDDKGDWRIDALHRELPHDGGRLTLAWQEAVLEPARRAYHRWVRLQAERFARGLESKPEYRAKGFLPQSAFWADLVPPPPRASAVLVVDALRADLAFDLRSLLAAKHREMKVHPVLAELPTRTEVGMAALLPGAKGEFAVRVEQGKLTAYIGAHRVRGVNERTKRLQTALAQEGRKVRRERVDAFLRGDGKLLAECRSEGVLPVAYTTDIDDGGDVAARVSYEPFRRVIETCAEFVERALGAGFAEVLVAADHGFLVRDPDAAPGAVPGTDDPGPSFARGVRYAAGTGIGGPHLLRLPAKALGRGGDDVYVPRDLSCVAIPGGAGLFVHGGLSPQECALVFLRVLPGRGATKTAALVPVRLEVPAKVDALSLKIVVAADKVADPLFTAARKVHITVSAESSEWMWSTDEPLTVAPSSRATVIATLPSAGVYRVAAVDAESGLTLHTDRVHVEVLGDDFGF